MKNLIILFIIPLTMYGQTKTSKISNIENIPVLEFKIPPLPDFNPNKFFNTPEGKLMEICYQYEEMMAEYYAIEKPTEAEEIRNCPGFTLKITKDSIHQNLTRAELFLAIAFLAKEKFIEEENSDDIYLLNGCTKIYLNAPISKTLSQETTYSMYQQKQNFFFFK